MELYLIPQDVLIYKVLGFLNYDILGLTNKHYWINYYKIKIDNLKINKSYNRFLIRNDFNFIYNFFISNSLDIFIKNKKFVYKNKHFTRYIDLSLFITNRYNSSKCKTIIQNIMKKHKLIFKNIKTNKNIWTN